MSEFVADSAYWSEIASLDKQLHANTQVVASAWYTREAEAAWIVDNTLLDVQANTTDPRTVEWSSTKHYDPRGYEIFGELTTSRMVEDPSSVDAALSLPRTTYRYNLIKRFYSDKVRGSLWIDHRPWAIDDNPEDRMERNMDRFARRLDDYGHEKDHDMLVRIMRIGTGVLNEVQRPGQ